MGEEGCGDRTDSCVALHFQDFDAFGDGGTGVVDYVDHCLGGEGR
jgi:hypothetical protein